VAVPASSPPPINRDGVTPQPGSAGEIQFERRVLGDAAGAARAGCSLFVVPAGARQMPVHVHGDEEETFYVLGGGGLSWQRGAACSVGPGDVIVHRAQGDPHTFLAGDEGLELLAFSSGTDTGITYLPRARVMWCGPRWVPVDSPHPFTAEAQAGSLERPEPGERPANVIAADRVPSTARGDGQVRGLGRAAGSLKAGLNQVALGPGVRGAPPHCHALEEELFYVLDGSGTLSLGEQRFPLRSGDMVARPPGTGVAHSITAGEEGITYLVYGTRVAGDSVYYPETGKLALRGLGVTIDASS
jgi:uncharacterized cupin superfamily protein